MWVLNACKIGKKPIYLMTLIKPRARTKWLAKRGWLVAVEYTRWYD